MNTNQPLNPTCHRFNHALKDAMAAVHHLSDHDLKPLSIRIEGRRPVIVIEPPAYTSFLRGALLMRQRVGNVVRTTLATSVHGCQVEWQIEAPLQAQAVGDV